MIKPITPDQKDIKDAIIESPIYDEAVRFINGNIVLRNWHKMWTQREELRENYYAIIQTPVDKYTAVMPMVVDAFKQNGWDCLFESAYDARGPHHCFYVAKKHFE